MISIPATSLCVIAGYNMVLHQNAIDIYNSRKILTISSTKLSPLDDILSDDGLLYPENLVKCREPDT